MPGHEAGGLAWGVLACLLFGSFGVPIKAPAVVQAKVDPVVFQCYKTAACFCSCWLALLIAEFKFTYWGFVGAAIWVLNGTCAIAAVQKAGLAVSQSLWSGLSIVVSFLWGTYVFGETPRSPVLAWFAIVLMSAGMVAIGYGAASKSGNLCKPHGDGDAVDDDVESEGLIRDEDGEPLNPLHARSTHAHSRVLTGTPSWAGTGNVKYASKGMSPRQFTTGIALATYVGVANGSFAVPLKYANQTVKGAEYLVSFGIGAAVLTALFVAAYCAVLTFVLRRPLPSAHVSVAAKPALATGLLWSAGNACSIFAAEKLGLSVGWPLVQCQLLVSVCWGVFYYREVTGAAATACIFAGSAVVLAGVGLLAQFGAA